MLLLIVLNVKILFLYEKRSVAHSSNHTILIFESLLSIS